MHVTFYNPNTCRSFCNAFPLNTLFYRNLRGQNIQSTPLRLHRVRSSRAVTELATKLTSHLAELN